MGILAEALQPTLTEEQFAPDLEETFEGVLPEVVQPAHWDPESFSQEQMRGLVRQVFFPGGPKAARQVVLGAVDPQADITAICLQVAETLAEQVAENVCLVEANRHAPGLERTFGRNRNDGLCAPDTAEAMRQSSRQISPRLWLASWDLALGQNGFSASWLRSQLGELRRQYEYAVLHAPPAGMYSETALLGHLTDGVILVLEAHSTRRIAAQKAKERLLVANARLLGTVLSERRFPIPERIYRRL
jgi:Mrp family chromosome partitioning ATPase